MRSMRTATFSVLCALATAVATDAQDYRYALLQLPSQNKLIPDSGIGGMNAHGDVVGGSVLDSIWLPRAVLWPHEGGVIDIGTLGGDVAGAAAINDLGEIVGSSSIEPGGSIFVGHAFLWRDGKMIDLGTLGGESSGALAINNLTQIVGMSEFEPDNRRGRGFLWVDGKMTVLRAALPGYYSSDVADIDEEGAIVGEGPGLDLQYNAHLWRDGEVIDLGSLAGRGSRAEAINAHGEIAGQSNSSNGNLHAVVWIDGRIIDIHDGRFGVASWMDDINGSRQVIGSIGNGLGTRQMFIREPGQPMRLLKDLIPPQTRRTWRLDRGKINDAGQIATTAFPDGSGVDSYALLLTPVQPTMEMQPPSPGRAGVANVLTATNATPGARVTFLYSRFGGGQRIPGCDLQQNALQLDSPTIIGTAIADQNGVATITRTVPPVARNQTILFQAVVQNECAISQLVVHQFE